VKRAYAIGAAVFLATAGLLAAKTYCDIIPYSKNALQAANIEARFQIMDRNGVPLTISYQNALNVTDNIPLYDVPPLLQQAFITAEDKRFYQHHGVDWRARFAAVWQDLRALHSVRGASTISEQAVRIMHPRPRTLWSRWIEGFEAAELERHASKPQILEFYLNQVPYAAQRRGVRQAARYYFNREVSTLTPKEILALAVLPRAPSAYDLYHHPDKINPAIGRLASAMQLKDFDSKTPFVLGKPEFPAHAEHFVNYIRENVPSNSAKLVTTLDSHLQAETEKNLSERLKALKSKQVHNGAVLVADYMTGEILVWAVAGGQEQAIDAVRTPRQPGSSMKPFLYAEALDKGWSPATIIEDAPIAEEINSGMHRFTNYSHMFYGKVSLREALGNSLNIPAIHTINYVGVDNYLSTLHRLGFDSLTKPADYYNEGLALGDGEVTLYEMVRGYAALANRGMFRPLTPLLEVADMRSGQQVYSEEAASLVGNILSDPWARQLEFGMGSILNMPIQTAVKTGTSTDYHDAWALGYNSRYVVGVWMGNLDGTPMDGITGSTGPALVLHSVFADVTRHSATAPLYLSPKLERRNICMREPEKHGGPCFMRSEYFIGNQPQAAEAEPAGPPKPALLRPADGVYMAYDPRVPARKQAFEFVAQGIAPGQKASWLLNGQWIATTDDGRYLWTLARGDYQLTLQVADAAGAMHSVDNVSFHVK
jgi:penicillin-binding protein 1C